MFPVVRNNSNSALYAASPINRLDSLFDRVFSDDGGVANQTWSRMVCLDGEDVVIKVRDKGIGISAEMLPRIFDLFMQADYSLDRSRGGLGIGLTLVKSLVVMHGGSIHADSAGLGQGCEIVVRLPVSTTSPAEAANIPPPVARTREIQRHILVVDDNTFSVDSLALILQLAGHNTRSSIAVRKHSK